jgi:vancomycin resistance protein YoaR
MESATEKTTNARIIAAELRRRRGERELQTSAVKKRAALVAAVLIGVLVLVCAVDAFASVGRVHPGVSVGGVAVGGKTPDEANATLSKELPVKAGTPVAVTGSSDHWTVSAEELGGTFNYVDLTAQAMSVGRSGGLVTWIRERAGAWFRGTVIPAPLVADDKKLTAVIGRIASKIDVAPKDAELTVSTEGVKMDASATGIAVNRQRLQSELLLAFASETSRTVAIQAGIAYPHIGDAQANEAKATVETMMDGPVTVEYLAKSWTLSEAELAKMIIFQSVESTGTHKWRLVPLIGTKQASQIIVPKVGAALGALPRDARFVTHGGRVSITPSKDGVGPDVEDFSASLTTVLKNPQAGRTVQLHTKITAPKLTTEAARKMGITNRISTFTTEYNPGVASRVNNIHLLGDALDGKMVPPGGTFTFNGAVGERTASKGYKEANAIVKGKLVPQLGGGICQVATTMFNAVFFSGFPVVERENHSFYISHYPTGRDATVSWGGPDLRWRNPTTHWVMVAVGYSSDSITVSLYGTDPGYEVAYETGKFTNIVPYKKNVVKDPSLASGLQLIEDPGVDGKKVVVTRTVKENGRVIRTDTFTSNYGQKSATVKLGTKLTGSKTATTTPAPKKKP